MSNIAIKLEGISKKYKIGKLKSNSLRESFGNRLSDFFSDKSNSSPEFWALQELSFSVNEGDVIGIVGKNGAGKSTLLKILSKITKPTYGRIEVYGRIASLLEVGTGFHPELTGRENVFLNGTILGMSRSEVNAKFDEIVEFSGIEKFIDTPVKRYSSGMSVRLAFAVAAHLEPEILIVDEVLAVGDAEFQKKCLGKMGEVSKNEGKTILFVSHSLPALKSICTKGILLDKGKLVLQSDIHQVIKKYSSTFIERNSIFESVEYYNTELFTIEKVEINESESSRFIQDSKILNISLKISFHKTTPFEMDFHIKRDDFLIASYSNYVKQEVKIFKPGSYLIKYKIYLPDLLSGNYELDLYFTEAFIRRHAGSVNSIQFEMVNVEHSSFLNLEGMTWGKVLMQGKMESVKLI